MDFFKLVLGRWMCIFSLFLLHVVLQAHICWTHVRVYLIDISLLFQNGYMQWTYLNGYCLSPFENGGYCIHKIPWKIWVDFQSYTNAVFLWPALYLMSLEHKVQTDVNLLSSTFLWSCILILWSVRSVFDFYFSNRKFLFVFRLKTIDNFKSNRHVLISTPPAHVQS